MILNLLKTLWYGLELIALTLILILMFPVLVYVGFWAKVVDFFNGK